MKLHRGVKKTIDQYRAIASMGEQGPIQPEPDFEEVTDKESLAAMSFEDTISLITDDMRSSLSPGKRRTVK